MVSIEDIALQIINAMKIIIQKNHEDKIDQGITKLNIVTQYPIWFHYKYSDTVKFEVNNLIKKNFNEILQQRVFEILNKEYLNVN